MSTRTCGRCHQPPRRDDPLQVVQWGGEFLPTTTAAICRDCEAEVRGEVPPLAPTYPVGQRVPSDFFVCGVCRHSMREGDVGELMRLAPADIEAGQKLKPGLYHACRDCIEYYRPLIWLRFLENPSAPNWPVNLQGVVTVPRDYENFQGNWLQ